MPSYSEMVLMILSYTFVTFPFVPGITMAVRCKPWAYVKNCLVSSYICNSSQATSVQQIIQVCVPL